MTTDREHRMFEGHLSYGKKAIAEGHLSYGKRPMTRRMLLKRAGATALAATAAGSALAACGSGSSTGGGGGGSEELRLLTWESYQNPDWLKEFTDQTGIKVVQATVGSPAEMFAKYKASPEQYDIAYVTAGWFGQWTEQDYLIPIEESRVTALKEVNDEVPWRDATTVDDKLYGVMYNWGDQPMGWNTADIPGEYEVDQYLDSSGNIVDWKIYWDPQFKGKVSIFDDLSFVEPMVLFAYGVKDPYNLDDAGFKTLEEGLSELGSNIRRLAASPNDQLNGMATGEEILAYVQLPVVVVEATQQGIPLKMNHVLKQPMPAWCDNASITQAAADKLDAVYEFINYELSLDWQARFIGETGNNGTLSYASATSPQAKAQGLDKEALDITLLPLTKSVPDFFGKFSMAQSVEDLDRRIEIWDQFKLGL